MSEWQWLLKRYDAALYVQQHVSWRSALSDPRPPPKNPDQLETAFSTRQIVGCCSACKKRFSTSAVRITFVPTTDHVGGQTRARERSRCHPLPGKTPRHPLRFAPPRRGRGLRVGGWAPRLCFRGRCVTICTEACRVRRILKCVRTGRGCPP